ncbi:MAG: MBL fold metallo-hydrolase [Acidobacteria bacterium]|nr:MBL fold metallo-hydrolase [Acidobacteriota bacterium]
MNPRPLHAANPNWMTGGGNWTFLIEGRMPTLIDAGVGRPAHIDALAAAAPGGPHIVLVTHAHPDHASGAPVIHSRWPATRFAKFPWPVRDERYAVIWEDLSDGDRLPAGDTELVAIHTPGHAPDHIVLLEERTRTVFSGDLVVLGSSVVIQASSGGNLADYLRSLERVRALAPARLLPAHGPAIDDPLAVIDEYVQHRRQRETQVLNALEAGLTTIAEMVSRIYPSLDPALVPMACESVLAHLEKLESERGVRRAEGGWTLY